MNPLARHAVDAPSVPEVVAAPPVRASGTATPQARVTAPSGLAIGGVVVGSVALLVSAVPFVNVVSVLGGIAAVVVGVVVLRRLAPGAAGRGLAVTAVVLGVLATAVAAAVLLVAGTLVITADRISVDGLGPVEVVEEADEPIDPDGVVVAP